MSTDNGIIQLMSDETNTENKDMERTARGEQAPAIPAVTLLPGQRLLKNGAVYDEQRSRIVANNPALNPHAITKENTYKYHELRHDRSQAAIQRGMIAGADRRDIDGSIEAIAEAQTHIAVNEMAGRASTEAARFLFTAAGIMPDRKGESDNTTARDIGRGIADVLCRLLQDNGSFIAENDIIDGEIVGNGNDPAPESE
jgi:hypothetical protein